MTEADLTTKTLNALEDCRSTALNNISFYESFYDELDDGPDKDVMGRVMAQKQSFVGAVDAVLSNHEINSDETQQNKPANDCDSIIECGSELGQHLKQEVKFQAALEKCISLTNDEVLEDLLNHHLEAAEIAITAIKSTSLKI